MRSTAMTVLQRPEFLEEPTCRFGFNFQWWASQPGVYQIFVGDQSYIGQARSLKNRLRPGRHRWVDQATRYRVLTLFDDGVSDKELRNAETYWIRLLRPELNVKASDFFR